MSSFSKLLNVTLLLVLPLAITWGMVKSFIEAQEGTWVSLNGPYFKGGSVSAFSIFPSSPNVLYTAIGNMVYKSTDGAISWNRIYTAPIYIKAIAPHPSDPMVVYAGGDNGLYKSIDGGLNWTQIYTIGTCLAIDPITPTTIYASGAVGENGISLGVAKSIDGGENWTLTIVVTDTNLNRPIVMSLALNPVTPTTLYLGSEGSLGKGDAIYKSTDGGRSWVQVMGREHGWGPGITSILVNPQTPERVYAAGHRYIYKSIDGGSNWARLRSIPEDHYSITLDPQNPEILYAAPSWSSSAEVHLYKSFDGGETWWSSISTLKSGVEVIAVHPWDSEVVYSGLLFYGIHKSTNGGGSWTEMNEGISSLAYVNALAVDPANPQVIYAASAFARGGIFKSEDGGNNWTTVLTDTLVQAIAINPITTTTLYAAGPKGCYQSLNDGQYWELILDLTGYCLAIDPLEPNTVYVGGSIGYPGQGVIYKRENGWRWVRNIITDSYRILDIAIHPVNTSIVYAASLETGTYGKSGSVLRSDDGGLTWTRVLTDVPILISTLLIDPQNPDTIYAGTYLGSVYKSTNGGENWSRNLVRGPGMVYDLVMDWFGAIYAGTDDGVYHSIDGGDTWTAFGFGLENKTVRSLVVIPGDPTKILAGISPGGVWQFSIIFKEKIYLPLIMKS